MAEINSDDRMHVRLEWPADDQQALARPKPRRAGQKGSGTSSLRTATAKKAAATKKAAPAGKKAVSVGLPEDAQSTPPPRRARPLEASRERPPRAAASRARGVESAGAASSVLLTRKRSTVVNRADPAQASLLPAVADRVDALTHALISLHSLVSDRLTDHSAQIMDAIDGSLATLARHDDEQARALDELITQVRALRQGQGELVAALTELLQRAEPPPGPTSDPRQNLSVSPLRRRMSKWLSGAAESVGAPPSSGA